MTTSGVDLSIIIINWNTKQLLLDCLASIYSTVHRASSEIFVVDNGSSDGSIEAVARSYPAVKLIANGKNLGFAGANNRALRRMSGRYAVLLNSDTVLKESSLESMLDFMERHPRAGICGPQLLNKDGSKQTSTGSFPTLATEFMSRNLIRVLFPQAYRHAFLSERSGYLGPTPVEYIIGACMMVRSAAIEAVGMLDEDYFFLYEEIDWCFRMKKAGWSVYHLPDVEIYHLGGQSMKGINLRARAESWRSRYLFFKKNMNLSISAWYGLLLLGFSQNVYQFMVYSFMNILTLFCVRKLRRRWMMFGYLINWHLRGMPDSMGIPR